MTTPDLPVPGVEPTVAAAMIDTGDALLLDVRDDDEWAAGLPILTDTGEPGIVA